MIIPKPSQPPKPTSQPSAAEILAERPSAALSLRTPGEQKRSWVSRLSQLTFGTLKAGMALSMLTAPVFSGQSSVISNQLSVTSS